MEARDYLPNYTVEDWEQWEGKWELIQGIPYAMSPAPAPKHQWLANNIGTEFRIALKPCRQCKVYQPIDWKITKSTVLEPDIVIHCKEIIGAKLLTPPELVVEILSPSTVSKDRMVKYNLFRQQGVKYCLFVDPAKEWIEVHLLEDGHYTIVEKGHDFSFEFSFSNGCMAAIDFNEIW